MIAFRRIAFLALIACLCTASVALADDLRDFTFSRTNSSPVGSDARVSTIPQELDPSKEVPAINPFRPKVPIDAECLEGDTSFACGSGQGPYNVPSGSIGNPAQHAYFHGECDPGVVSLAVYRTTFDMDPAAHACEGHLTDSTQSSAFFCAATAFLASADDNNGIPCGVGGSFADPRMSFACPASGQFTLVVYDFIGAGPNPTFEVHSSGTNDACGPPPVGDCTSCDIELLDAVDAIEDKLDARLDVAVSTRASQASVDALDGKLCEVIKLLLTPQGIRETDECGGGSWNDKD